MERTGGQHIAVAKLHHAAFRQNQQLVGRQQHIGPVRHHDYRRAGFAQGGDRAGQRSLARRIEIGVWLVQNHQRGRPAQRAGEPYALDLTARQRCAFAQTADTRGIAVGQMQDHVMHPGGGGGGDHLGITDGGVEAGDIVAQAAGQQVNLLRQIADMAAQQGWIPLVAGGTVQPDLAAIGSPGPGQQPRQRGFAAGRSPDHPHGVAGGQGEADAIEQARAVGIGFAPLLRGQFHKVADADLPGGRRQGDDGHRYLARRKERRQTAVRFQRLADTAPLADHLINRSQRAASQDRRGDDHAARHLTLNDKIGAKGQDRRLHQHAESAASSPDHLCRIAGLLACCQPRLLQLPPAGTDGTEHAHGQDHLGIALAAFGKIAGHGIIGQAAGDLALAQTVACPGQNRHDPGPADGQPAEPGMHHEQHGQIQGHPGQIEQAGHRGAGDKAAQGIEVAQGLRCGCGAKPAPEGLRPKAAIQPQRQP